MSTVVFASLTPPSNPNVTVERRAIQQYASVATALVPAEVLAAHAVIVSYATEGEVIGGGTTGKVNLSLTFEPAWLGPVAFYSLLILAALVYVAVRVSNKEWTWRRDVWRMLIPAVAFVAWTMAEPGSLFGTVVPSLGLAPRAVIGVLLGLVLTLASWVLAYELPRSART